MKKAVLASAFAILLAAFPVHADSTTTAYQLNGYNVSVEETKTTVRISVQSTSPYGYQLFSSSTKKAYEDGMPVRELTVVFGVAPEINLQQPIKASGAYSTSFTKKTIQKIYLTVKTDAVTNVGKQLIWSRNQE